MKKKISLWPCELVHGKEGMGTIEVVIIIAVLVTLALIFKDFIIDLAKGIFSNIEEGAESATQIL